MVAVSQPHLLVVDDDASIREGLALALARTYLVHCAATGEDACVALQTHSIRAIILDAILGDENGLDLVDRFRTVSPAPILILTGHSTEELAVRAVWARVGGYIKKPVDIEALHSAISRLVFPTPLPLDPMARVRLHLEEHFGKEIDLGALAGECGLSEGHLRQRFRETHGKTPRQFLTEVRMRRARELLPARWWGIEEIAREIGYPNAVRFARLFKRRFGITPSEFRIREAKTARSAHLTES